MGLIADRDATHVDPLGDATRTGPAEEGQGNS